VDTSRASKLCRTTAAAAALTVVACGASGRPSAPLALLPDASREPDGVVLDQPPALPDVSEHAPARGVVALRPPLGSEAVLIVVHRLFRGFTRGGMEALEAIVTEDATVLGASRGRGPLLEQWRTRLRTLSYAKLAAGEIVEDAKIERFAYEDLDLPGAPERPAAMKPGELLVRFPVATPRAGSEQLFGDEMTLLLRREGPSYKIAGFGEENGP
jgi:hypothetical protein